MFLRLILNIYNKFNNLNFSTNIPDEKLRLFYITSLFLILYENNILNKELKSEQ